MKRIINDRAKANPKYLKTDGVNERLISGAVSSGRKDCTTKASVNLKEDFPVLRTPYLIKD